MESDAYQTARQRYWAAYDAYQARAQRVLEKLRDGMTLSADEIAEESRSAERLAAMRRELLDAMAEHLRRT
jgi:hypothetical protein